MHINNCFILSNFLNYVSNITSINCHIAVMIRDVCSHGSPLTQRVTHDGKNQISGNQRVSVGRTASPGGPNTDHLLFRFALNLETESAVRPRRRRPAIGDGWVSPLTVLSIHALAPFPQLNNCIHIHPPVLPVRSRPGSPSSSLRSPFLRPSVPHCPRMFLSSFVPKRRTYNGLVTGRFRLEAIYDQIAR